MLDRSDNEIGVEPSNPAALGKIDQPKPLRVSQDWPGGREGDVLGEVTKRVGVRCTGRVDLLARDSPPVQRVRDRIEPSRLGCATGYRLVSDRSHASIL